MASDAPTKLADLQKDRRSAVAEALFQRRKRFKRAIDSTREGPLTPAEQVAELGSEQGAQEVLRAATFLAKRRIGERLRAHARKTCARASAYCSRNAVGQTHTHRHSSPKKACLNPRMLDDVLEAVGATAQPGPENVDAFLLPNAPQPRKSVLLNVALSGSVLFSP